MTVAELREALEGVDGSVDVVVDTVSTGRALAVLTAYQGRDGFTVIVKRASATAIATASSDATGGRS